MLVESSAIRVVKAVKPQHRHLVARDTHSIVYADGSGFGVIEKHAEIAGMIQGCK